MPLSPRLIQPSCFWVVKERRVHGVLCFMVWVLGFRVPGFRVEVFRLWVLG